MAETWLLPAPEEARPPVHELRGTWAFVTWGAMVTLLLVPFTNTYIPHTARGYSVMSVTQLFFWACLLLSPRVLRRGYSPVLGWMAVLFGIRYIYGWLLSDFPELMADSTRNMIRPMLWAWILSAVMRDGRWRRRACDAFVLGAALAAALHAAGIGVTGEITGVFGTRRVAAFELNPNVLGVIYATAFVIAFARVVQPRSGYGLPARLGFAGSCALLMAGELLAGSRMAAAFTAIGALILVGVEMRRARWPLPAVFLSALLVGGAFAAGFSDSIIGKRSETVVDSGLGSEDRARMAPVLVEQFLRSPVYGLGPENYRVELGNRSGTGEPGVGIVAHNQLFMFSVEMGLFGLVPFLAICFLLLRQAWRVRNEEGGLPLALVVPTVITACTVTNIAFHWHFHFIVGLVAGSYGAFLDRKAARGGGRP